MNPTDPAMLPRYDAEEVARIFGCGRPPAGGWLEYARRLERPFPWTFADVVHRVVPLSTAVRAWACEKDEPFMVARLRWRSLCIDPHVCDGAVHVAGTDRVAGRVASTFVDAWLRTPIEMDGDPLVSLVASGLGLTPDAVRDCCAYAGVECG